MGAWNQSILRDQRFTDIMYIMRIVIIPSIVIMLLTTARTGTIAITDIATTGHRKNIDNKDCNKVTAQSQHFGKLSCYFAVFSFLICFSKAYINRVIFCLVIKIQYPDSLVSEKKKNMNKE